MQIKKHVKSLIKGFIRRYLILSLRRILVMADHIPVPTMGEILREEFMVPLNISAYRLAKDINVPSSRILEILHDKRKISPDTALRLAKYFGLTEKYFLNIQNDIDIRNLKEDENADYEKIVPYTA